METNLVFKTNLSYGMKNESQKQTKRQIGSQTQGTANSRTPL